MTMTDTYQRILDSAQLLIQTRGFNAISYQDISDDVGIKKASIHHHFPSKFSLGKAVIERYRNEFNGPMAAAEQNDRLSPWKLLEFYFQPYREFAGTEDKVCLCGALAGEFLALPTDMQTEVSTFFAEHQDWLRRVLAKGKKSGAFHFADSANREARLFFSALQGALIVKRANGDLSHVDEVIGALKARLKPPRITK